MRVIPARSQPPQHTLHNMQKVTIKVTLTSGYFLWLLLPILLECEGGGDREVEKKKSSIRHGVKTGGLFGL